MNFRRREAGAIEYRFEPLDPADLVERGRGRISTRDRRKRTSHRGEGDRGHALYSRLTREALGRALWNLLDERGEVLAGVSNDLGRPGLRGPARGDPALEFRQQDFPKATAAFRTLADSDDPLIQAGALVRLARTLRKNNQHEDALAAYEALERLGPTPVGGVPAELLLARQMRCTVLDELNQVSELQRAAVALYADLQNGRWPLDRASYEFHSAETRRWLTDESDAQEPQEDALALAAAVESLWEQWQARRSDEGESRGTRSVRVYDRSMLVVWRSSSGGLGWAGRWYRLSRVAVADRMGRPRRGRRAHGPRWSSCTRAIAFDSHPTGGAPGGRHAASLDVACRERGPGCGSRRAGRTPSAPARRPGHPMALLVLGGGYFVTRAVTRELAVARLQTDFVSAVSHEFRSPLTAMRHLTELLAGGIVTSEERRRQYYCGASARDRAPSSAGRKPVEFPPQGSR